MPQVHLFVFSSKGNANVTKKKLRKMNVTIGSLIELMNRCGTCAFGYEMNGCARMILSSLLRVKVCMIIIIEYYVY